MTVMPAVQLRRKLDGHRLGHGHGHDCTTRSVGGDDGVSARVQTIGSRWTGRWVVEATS